MSRQLSHERIDVCGGGLRGATVEAAVLLVRNMPTHCDDKGAERGRDGSDCHVGCWAEQPKKL